MNKFKVGDKVKLKSSLSCINLNHIDTYTVRKSYTNVVELIGLEYSYPEQGFNLIEQSNDNSVATGILTPLEAAEAMLNKDKLQVFDSDANKWYGFHNELRNITLEDLKHIKLRHKPKTVIINGVEVIAPIKTVTLSYPDKVWGLNLTRKSVYSTTGHTNKGLFWATEEDAQKALDAMLIPFDKLNKGDK